MLHVETLLARAGEFWLREVDLRVAEGEIHAVLGPSGSGKTTLLNVVLGLLPPLRGSVTLKGVDITRHPVEQRGLGYVPQQLGLFPHLSVRDNLAYGARARRMRPGEFQPVVDRLVDATGLGAVLDRMPATLSGGERQRVGLVRALACRPRLILLDEPFSSLHESLRRELWGVVHDLRSQYGMTLLLVTHSLEEAHFLSDRVSVLSEGRVAQQGATEEVFAKPSSLSVGKFLGVGNLLPARVVDVEAGQVELVLGAFRLVSRASLPEGARQVIACIRSESVLVSRRADGELPMGGNRLPARVVSVRPGRQQVEVALDAGFLLVAAMAPPVGGRAALRPGDNVTASVDPADVHLITAREEEPHV